MTPSDSRSDGGGQTEERLGDRVIAIALSYDLLPDNAPKVVASGSGALAEAILALAFEAGVNVRQDADLAELLSVIDVGDEIPVEAFHAVAEILNYVYQLNGRLPDLEEAR